MRIHRNVRRVVGMVAMFMALASVRQLILDMRVFRVYDPEMVADLTWIAISLYGIVWGFRERPETPGVDG